MITLYSGTPGSGKSYYATKRIYEALNRPHPKPVIANFDINHETKNYDEYYTYLDNSAITPELLVNYSRKYFENNRFGEDKILLVLDEIQIIANSRTWADKSRMGLITFLSQHRHFGYEIVMIAQSANMIDKQFRPLIEYETKFRKLANFGIVGFLLSLLAFGRAHCGVTYYYGLKERLGVNFFVTRSKIYKLYDSYTEFRQTGDDAVATAPDPSDND